MKWARLMLACLIGIAGCDASPPPASTVNASAGASASSASPATTAAVGMAHYNGYGDMHFGMDEATVRKAWQGDLAGTSDAGGGCYYLSPKWVTHPADFAFMFEHGAFVRYDVGTPKEIAPGGGRIGMTIAQIHVLYGGRVQDLPHKYVPGARYLRVSAEKGDVLIFETDAAGKVARWRVGVAPQIDYVEGCG